jgi:endonuclease/exonuclease/phosphatase family metal-dependent hydrolase
MWVKIHLTVLCLLMIAFAIHFDLSRPRSLLGSGTRDGPHLRLITWNIGYAELEDDSRAHTQDLKAVADTILSNDPDAVALQELVGPEQLKILLSYLHGRYRGAVAPLGNADRVEAVLVKDRDARFEQIAADGKYAFGLVSLQPKSAEVVMVSAHADAFSAARRRRSRATWLTGRAYVIAARVVVIGGDLI